jgi:hypothetical protein
MTVDLTDPRLIAQFNDYFKHWQITLPEAEMEIPETPVRISHSGWMITMIFGSEHDLPWMEIYAVHRMTNDRHIRFHVDREYDVLPALDEPVFIPEGASEEDEKTIKQAAILRHRMLSRELESIGLV